MVDCLVCGFRVGLLMFDTLVMWWANGGLILGLMVVGLLRIIGCFGLFVVWIAFVVCVLRCFLCLLW